MLNNICLKSNGSPMLNLFKLELLVLFCFVSGETRRVTTAAAQDKGTLPNLFAGSSNYFKSTGNFVVFFFDEAPEAVDLLLLDV